MWAVITPYKPDRVQMKNMWNILTTDSLLTFFRVFLMACSYKSHDQEIRKLEETLTIQMLYNLFSICFRPYQSIRNELLNYWNINILICNVQTLIMDYILDKFDYVCI